MRARCTALLLCTLLAACSPGPGVDAMFPLADGRTWTYRMTTSFDNDVSAPRHENLRFSVRGSETIEGLPAWRKRSDSGVDYWLRSDKTGSYRVASKSDVERDPKPDGAPRYVLFKPYVVGTQWDTHTTAFVLERPNEFLRELRHTIKPVSMRYRIEAVDQRVQTPAGNFDGCLRVQGRATIKLFVDAVGGWDDVPLTTTEWYCPDVGLVRLERKEPSPQKLMRGGTLTMELTAWH